MNSENYLSEEKEADYSPTDVIFCVTDEAGVEHKLRMLTIFEAGAMKRKYVAGVTCDIILYSFQENIVDGEKRKIVTEIVDETEYAYTLKMWETFIESGIDENEIYTDTVYMAMTLDDGTKADVPISGNIFKIFKTDYDINNEKDYIAICPQNIMFYRYSEDLTEGRESVTISQIYSEQEYDDIVNEFHKMIVNENE